MIWIFTYAFCLFDAWFNAWLETHWRIIHWLNAVYRIAFGVLMLRIYPMVWYLLLLYAVGAFCGYSQFFNISLNFLRVPRKPVLYVGSGPNAAVLDRFEKQHQIPVVVTRGILAVGCLVAWLWLA